MIRAATTILVGLVAASCDALPGLAFPELTVRPVYARMKMRGDARMQSAPGGGPIQNNPSMPVDDFGQGSPGDNFGVNVAYGDRFSGLEFDYMRFKIGTTDVGTLRYDFGAIPAGTDVNSEYFLDEFRLAYTAQFWEWEHDSGFLLRPGVGVEVAHREGKLDVRESTTAPDPIAQTIRFKDDGVVYVTARLRGEYQGFAGTVDYAWSDMNFGGDFEGPMQDIELTASYHLADQDLRFLVGYRWLELPASGADNGLEWDIDILLEGWVFGIELKF